MGDADLFTIDSSTPFLWLPETVCKRFEKALGLTYDDNRQLYTFGSNASQHDALLSWNMTFTFTIADLPRSTKAVNITLPYSAFDLQLSFPYPGLNATSSSPATNYFPLRKAANNTQYTIGRSFLQEAYLMVDYERNNFSVYQANFAADASTNQHLVNIDKPLNNRSNGDGASTNNSLSKGAIAGIVVASVIVLVGLVASLVLYSKKRRTGRPIEKPSPKTHHLHWFKRKSKEVPPNELPGTTHHPAEVPATPKFIELEATTPQELQGSPVTKTFSARDHPTLTLTLPYDSDIKPPSPLHYDRPAQRGYNVPEPTPSSLPAYSPSRVGRGPTSHTNTTTNEDVSRESTPSTTSALTPSTPMWPVSPLTNFPPHIQFSSLAGVGGGRGMDGYNLRGTGGTEEEPPVSAVSPEMRYPRYSWEDENENEYQR